jgi:hypothetical protein
VLPKSNYSNAAQPQQPPNLPPSSPVALKFGFPKGLPSLWDVAASRTPMPETAVHEHCQPAIAKIKIRAAGDISSVHLPS